MKVRVRSLFFTHQPPLPLASSPRFVILWPNPSYLLDAYRRMVRIAILTNVSCTDNESYDSHDHTDHT